jgi:hypothetical protein
MVIGEGAVVIEHPVMDWLAARVPLSLLMDLADPSAPDSREILVAEAGNWDFPQQRQAEAGVPSGAGV